MSTKQNKTPSISVSHPGQTFLLPAVKHIPNYHVIFLILLKFILIRNLTFFFSVLLKDRVSVVSSVHSMNSHNETTFVAVLSISYSAAVDRLPHADTGPRIRDWKASSKDSIPLPQQDALGVQYLHHLPLTPTTPLLYQILWPHLLLSLPELMRLYNMSIYFHIFLPLENNKVNTVSITSHIT